MRVEGKLEDGEILNENRLRKEESLRDNSVNVLDQVSMNTGLNLYQTCVRRPESGRAQTGSSALG